MVAYEILLMLDAGVAEPRQTEIVERVKSLVETGGGSWQSHVPWGKRRLAYEINHRSEGYYVVMQARSEPPAMEELSRVLSLADEVIRHKVLRIPESVYGPPAAASSAASAEQA